jgi:hypothetical protein
VLNLHRVRAVNDFARRAQLYAHLDQNLAQRTRFFGAAALTNSMLAGLFSRHTSVLTVSAATGRFLHLLGGYLEDFNLERVRRIHAAEAAGERLDVVMVQSEQAEVQDQLDRLELSNASTHKVVLTQLDRILNSPEWLAACANRYAGTTTYRSVLRNVRTQLGRPIQFGDRLHRECIGESLIGALRRTPTRTA